MSAPSPIPADSVLQPPGTSGKVPGKGGFEVPISKDIRDHRKSLPGSIEAASRELHSCQMAPKADAKARPSRAKPKETAPKETANRDHMDGMSLSSLAMAEQETSVACADMAAAKGKSKQKKLPKVISEEGRVRFAPRQESLLVDQVVRSFVPEEPDPVQASTVHRTQSQEISGLVASGWLQKSDEYKRARSPPTIQHMDFDYVLGFP